jgi:hypothetical protein
MILVEQKTNASNNSPLNLSTQKDEKTNLSFSQLLKGIAQKDDENSKELNNKTLVLALDSDKEKKLTVSQDKQSKDTEKKDFSSLLKNTQLTAVKQEIKTDKVEINPQATVNMTQKEIKLLIFDAKKYLKDKILQSDGYKIAQTKELPKTLRGLVHVAQKLGIDISKISLEEVKSQKNLSPLKNSNLDLDDVKNTNIKQEVKPENKVEVKSEIKPENKTEIKSEIKPENKEEVKPEIKSEIKLENTTEVKSEIKSQNKTETKPEIKSEYKTEIKPENKTEVKSEIKSEIKPENKPETKSEIKQEVKTQNKTDLQHEVKNTPLFKAQSETKITTEQALQVREFKISEPSSPLKKSAKDRANETLKLLISGEKATKLDSTAAKLTTDFSVATARVIAPTAATDAQKSLESLLKSDSSEQNTNSKIDGLNVPKSDSFEVKISEAKQMNKYLSQDVRQAIDNYKSPFTRIKLQLNPQKLGEVDLTVVQRGKNLHVNISSNNIAINALAMNANDLKTQLTNNGIQNATLNFSSGSSDGSQANQQQQDQRRNHQAKEEYNYYDKEEQSEEVLSSLEIIVPNYV